MAELERDLDRYEETVQRGEAEKPNAWRQRHPYAGPAEGWERLPQPTGEGGVGMIRGDRERNEPEGQPWIAAD